MAAKRIGPQGSGVGGGKYLGVGGKAGSAPDDRDMGSPRGHQGGERTLPTRAPKGESMGRKGVEPSMHRSGHLSGDKTPGMRKEHYPQGRSNTLASRTSHQNDTIPSKYSKQWANDPTDIDSPVSRSETSEAMGDSHKEDKSLPPRSKSNFGRGDYGGHGKNLDPATTAPNAGGVGHHLGSDKGDYSPHGVAEGHGSAGYPPHHAVAHALLIAHALRHMGNTSRGEGGDGG